jgi:hypothetical protein
VVCGCYDVRTRPRREDGSTVPDSDDIDHVPTLDAVPQGPLDVLREKVVFFIDEFPELWSTACTVAVEDDRVRVVMAREDRLLRAELTARFAGTPFRIDVAGAEPG